MEFFKKLEKHLSNNDAVISIVQGKLKLKKNTSYDKYNFSLQDILNQFSNIEEFIKHLPSKGFTTGASLLWRKKNGTSYKTLNETVLEFKNAPQQPQQPQTPLEPTVQVETQQKAQAPMQNNSFTQQPSLGYSVAPDLLSLHLKAERYADLLEKYTETKSEFEDTKRELREAKENLNKLTNKLETINDRHELEKERIHMDKRSFLDSDTGKEVVSALGQALPEFISMMKPQQQQALPAMGSPFANMQPEKKQLITQLMQLPDTEFPFLGNLLDMVYGDEAFKAELTEKIKTQSNG